MAKLYCPWSKTWAGYDTYAGSQENGLLLGEFAGLSISPPARGGYQGRIEIHDEQERSSRDKKYIRQKHIHDKSNEYWRFITTSRGERSGKKTLATPIWYKTRNSQVRHELGISAKIEIRQELKLQTAQERIRVCQNRDNSIVTMINNIHPIDPLAIAAQDETQNNPLKQKKQTH